MLSEKTAFVSRQKLLKNIYLTGIGCRNFSRHGISTGYLELLSIDN